MTEAMAAEAGLELIQIDLDGDGYYDLVDTDGDSLSDGDEVNLYGIDPTASNKGDVAPRGASDNLIGVGDLVVMTRLVTGVITPDALESTLADMNDDGELDAADILMLQQLILAVPAP